MPSGGRRTRSGRPRKPTDLKILQGTFRKDRHRDEIATPVGERKMGARWPKPPKGVTLSDRERKAWRELRKHCEPWTEPSDWPAVLGIVALYEMLAKSREDEAASGARSVMTNTVITAIPGKLKDANGNPIIRTQTKIEVKESPFRTQQVRIFKELRAYIGLQGMSAVDRARMRTGDGGGSMPKTSKIGDLIKRARG